MYNDKYSQSETKTTKGNKGMATPKTKKPIDKKATPKDKQSEEAKKILEKMKEKQDEGCVFC